MEVEAPLPCTESGGRALLRMCGRWTDRYFFKNPILLLDPKQPPADILSDDNHEKSTVGITNWEEEVKWDSIDGWTSQLKFTAMPSSEDLVDNYNGSQALHVEEHLSIVNAVLQMLRFASCEPAVSVFTNDECAFHCQKSMLPEGELVKDKKSLSSLITKQSPEMYTKRDAPGDGVDSFIHVSRYFSGVATDADNEHNIGRNVECNQIIKQTKTCGGGSGLRPDDDIHNMKQEQQQQQQQYQQQQQQQQQQQGQPETGVHMWPSELAPTHSVVKRDCLRACHWLTMFAAMNSIYIMYSGGNLNCENNSRCMTVSGMSSITGQKEHPELHSTFLSSITAQDSIRTTLKDTPAATSTTWIIASAAPHHATGNRALLTNFTPEHSDIFLFGGEAEAMPMQVAGRGVVITETMVLPDVWYVPGLVANLVSVSQLAELDYSIAFGRSKCYIRSTTEGTVVGAAHAGEDGRFALDFLRIPLRL